MLQMTLLFVPCLQGYNAFSPEWQQSMSLPALPLLLLLPWAWVKVSEGHRMREKFGSPSTNETM